MNQVANIRGPLGLKPPKAEKPPQRGLPRKSKKRIGYERSPEGKEDLAYMGDVRSLPCCICGTIVNVKAHHCSDPPAFADKEIYTQEPCKGRKSGARDTIPLCEPQCHKGGPEAYHTSPAKWAAKNGPDYSYIRQTRNMVKEMRESVDF